MKSICIVVCACVALSPAYGEDVAVSGGSNAAPLTTYITSASASFYAGANLSLRERMAVDAAYTAGFQAGLTERGAALAHGLEHRMRALDTLYSFATLIDKNGVLPPVVVEATDVMHITPDQVRSVGHVYRIERAARFVSVPPTWRDYLTTGLAPARAEKSPFVSAAPAELESLAARDAAAAGRLEGRAQADAILAANFNRLNRDYTGMIRYAVLLQQGMISMPVVSDAVQSVTGNAQQLMIDDRLRRLMAPAQLQPDGDQWRPIIVGEAPMPEADVADPVPSSTAPPPP